jgi:pyruvate kinase
MATSCCSTTAAEAEVTGVRGREIHTRVLVGGELSNNKGINRQGGGLTAPALTAKDMDDIKTAAADRRRFRRRLLPEERRRHVHGAPVAARRGQQRRADRQDRTRRSVTNLEEILDASDGIMVARGDLAVEVGDATVPALQKKMIRMARDRTS